MYPLPKGARLAGKERDVARQRGSTSIGVHEFIPKFFWSTDSEHIAFVDCLFDWVEKGVGSDSGIPFGDETNRRCFVAVVARAGKFDLFPIGDISNVEAVAMSISWDGPKRLSAQAGEKTRKFRIP